MTPREPHQKIPETVRETFREQVEVDLNDSIVSQKSKGKLSTARKGSDHGGTLPPMS